jgi:UDP-3-O-acyl-N-acetylglucosamine deacetylase
MALQKTIKNRMVCQGVGVHTGILPGHIAAGAQVRASFSAGRIIQVAGVVPAAADRVTDTSSH